MKLITGCVGKFKIETEHLHTSSLLVVGRKGAHHGVIYLGESVWRRTDSLVASVTIKQVYADLCRMRLL